jgi:hypothetical protein
MFEINEGVVRPQAPAQFFSSDGPSRVFEQRSQNLKRLRLQSDPNVVLSKHTLLKINLEGPKSEDGRMTTGLHPKNLGIYRASISQMPYLQAK